jgi:hypothetical protein
MPGKYVGTVFISDTFERRLRFQYSNRLIQELKTTFPVRKWNPENKEWIVTLTGPRCEAKLDRFVQKYGFVTELPKGTQPSLESFGTIATDLPWD